MRLVGKIAVVTGGTGALGRAVSKRLLAEGAHVHVPWVVDREAAELQAELGADAGKVTLYETDVTNEKAVAKLFDAVAAKDGGVDVLANIVGGFAFAALADTGFDTWRRMLDMNATSCFLCCRAAAAQMKPRGGGRIVNVAARPAVVHGGAMMSAYTASKAAVLAFTQALADELVKDRIGVNAIVPSIIDTPANRKTMPGADTSGWLPPEEIAGVVAYLASPEARIVTGAAVTLNLG